MKEEKNENEAIKSDIKPETEKECGNLMEDKLLDPSPSQKKEHFFGIDLIRVLACFLVMQTHAGEFYYINVKDGTVLEWDKKKYSGVFNSLARPCVPLFLMISGYLLLPMKTDISTFLKRRFTRVAFPFIFFCIVYDLYYYIKGNIDKTQFFINIPKILVNYGTEIGHLWYIYMVIGVYLFIPIISPWIKSASFDQYLYYIIIWGVSTFTVYIHHVYPEVWGECYWNNTGTLQSFIGNFGYVVLGAFSKLHLKNYNLVITGIILYAIGSAVTMGGFFYLMPTAKYCKEIELTWHFNTINLCLQTLGIFFALRRIKCENKWICKIFNDIALKSYGMYLIHIFFLNMFYKWFDGENRNPLWCIFALAFPTFFTSYLAVKIISYIPFSQYIIG